MTIVLVEDYDSVRRFIERALRASGWGVVSFASAEAALKGLPSGPFLLLTDLELPGMNGLMLWKRVRGRAARGLLISGSVPENERKAAERLGLPILPKPFTPQELESALRA